MSITLTVGSAEAGLDSAICEGDEASFGVGELILLGGGQLADVSGQQLTITGSQSRLTGNGKAVFTTTLCNCAVIAPGTSPGSLTLDGALDLAGGVSKSTDC